MENKVVWLVSYPRSGNTWMRFLVCNLLYPNQEIDYYVINKLAPDAHQTHAWKESGVENPKVIKCHDIWRDEYSDSKVLYIYRDVRDLVLSYYHYRQGKWSANQQFHGTFDEFLREVFIPGEQFGCWDEHVRFWFSLKAGVPLLLVKYEDLWEDTRWELAKVAHFLGVEKSVKEVEIAIEKSGFNTLEKYRESQHVHPKIKGLKGRPGGWKETLTKEQKDLIWGEFYITMGKLGYKKDE